MLRLVRKSGIQLSLTVFIFMTLKRSIIVLSDEILETIYFADNHVTLRLKEDMTTENIKTPEHTVCLRYKPELFSTAHHLYHMNFGDKVQEHRKLGTFDSWYFVLDIFNPQNYPNNIFQVRPNPTQWTQILAEGGTYYTSPELDTINAGEWHHFCGGSSVKDLKTFFVQNGKTAYNWSQPASWGGEENYLSSEVLKKPYTTYLPGMNETWENIVSFAKIGLGGSWAHFYKLTDFNVWGRALSREEMYDFTTCKVTTNHAELSTIFKFLVSSPHHTSLTCWAKGMEVKTRIVQIRVFLLEI